MLASIGIITPVFLLILVGFTAGRTGLVSPKAASGLSEFTFNVTTPALLFYQLATADLSATAPLKIWLSYYSAVLIAWTAASVGTRVLLQRPAPDAPAVAMSSCFGNTVMLGIPISLTALGPEAAGPLAVLQAMHTPFLWMLGLVHMGATTHQAGSSVASMIIRQFRELISSPLIIAIILGVAFNLLGFHLEPVSKRTLKFLADANTPSALGALGLSLVTARVSGQAPTLALITVVKLALMPALALSFGYALGLKPIELASIAITAGMPTGANAFLFATRFQRAVNSASGAVALTTLISLLSLSALIAWVRP